MYEETKRQYNKKYNQRPDVKERAASRTRRYRQQWNELIRELRSGPCVDCKVELPPEVMEFDHVRGEKRFHFCHAASFKLNDGEDRRQVILDEVAKCEIRCPNCHKMRHYTEENGHFSWRSKDYVYEPRTT